VGYHEIIWFISVTPGNQWENDKWLVVISGAHSNWFCQFGQKCCTVTMSKQGSSAEMCFEVSVFASVHVIVFWGFSKPFPSKWQYVVKDCNCFL
jgi:hypothetical protein